MCYGGSICGGLIGLFPEDANGVIVNEFQASPNLRFAKGTMAGRRGNIRTKILIRVLKAFRTRGQTAAVDPRQLSLANPRDLPLGRIGRISLRALDQSITKTWFCNNLSTPTPSTRPTTPA